MFFYVLLAFVFLIGTAIGSFLNVCVARLPYERSILWPGSHCFSCFQPVRWYDNIPLLSYLLLRGRCRTCGARFSVRYFLVELFTGLAFLGLLYLEVILNVHDLDVFKFGEEAWELRMGLIPATGWLLFGYHAVLLSFLIVVSLSDIDTLEIPLSITVTGMVVGLAGAMLFPWPWPYTPGDTPDAWQRPLPEFLLPGFPRRIPRCGLYPCPVWDTLPAWMPHGSVLAGLAAGLAGLAAGMVPRAVGFLYKLGRRREGMGLGDADLMMMVGCFLGWQPTIVAFFVALAPGLVFGVAQLVFRGGREMPFGPSLALATVVTWLCWGWFAPRLASFFFDGPLVVGVCAFLVVGLFVAFSLLGAVRGRGQPE